MPVFGPTKTLGDLAQDLKKIAGGKVLREARVEIAEDALARVQLGFERATSPFGEKWQPIRRSGQILRKSGRLMNSIHRKMVGSGFEIVSNVKYARIQNEGGVVKKAARSQIQHYSAKGKQISGKQFERLKAKGFKISRGKSARRVESSIGAHVISIGARQFIPYPGQLPKPWERSFKTILRKKYAKAFISNGMKKFAKELWR